ncbi:hypothetical protein TL16_g08579 [Triparma laevis f. inornata]|uniref:Uncharacterized protein n=1 Tax=Triparma laevis f. inornata TaxID=1714386 RepID=A0A9W7EGS4_9STRA|nr:hypothetical protein TL16_g08579 [Triparma laevis f. inornata]
MSKPTSTGSKDSHDSGEMGKKRGAEDEGNEEGDLILDLPLAESLTTSPAASTVPATTSQFLFTEDFKMLLVGFVRGDTLMALRVATKAWKVVADALIDEGMRSGELMDHGGNDTYWKVTEDRGKRRKLVTRVIFLLNIKKVGDFACYSAINLVVVDIPEGVVSIGKGAFSYCFSLTTVSFSTTLTSIGEYDFEYCSSLDNVDLLHSNLQELGNCAFFGCGELKSMTIPDSLQTLGKDVFCGCSKLVLSNIMTNDTDAVVAYLFSKQTIS